MFTHKMVICATVSDNSSFGVQNNENKFPHPHHSCSNRIVNVSSLGLRMKNSFTRSSIVCITVSTEPPSTSCKSFGAPDMMARNIVRRRPAKLKTQRVQLFLYGRANASDATLVICQFIMHQHQIANGAQMDRGRVRCEGGGSANRPQSPPAKTPFFEAGKAGRYRAGQVPLNSSWLSRVHKLGCQFVKVPLHSRGGVSND